MLVLVVGELGGLFSFIVKVGYGVIMLLVRCVKFVRYVIFLGLLLLFI